MKCREFRGISRIRCSVQIPLVYRDFDGTSIFRWNIEVTMEYGHSMKYRCFDGISSLRWNIDISMEHREFDELCRMQCKRGNIGTARHTEDAVRVLDAGHVLSAGRKRAKPRGKTECGVVERRSHFRAMASGRIVRTFDAAHG